MRRFTATLSRVLAAFLVGLVWASLATLASAAEAVEDRRKYEDGPLAADDFRAPVQQIPGIAAHTITELRYTFRCRFEPAGKLTRAVLTNIEVQAYIRRDRSWNREPHNKSLLDHEQGHADIIQAHCLRARLAFRERMRTGKIEVTGNSQREAEAALGRKIEALIFEFRAARQDDDAQYDRATHHGLGGQQAEWRRVQIETLRQLAEQWQPAASGAGAAASAAGPVGGPVKFRN